MIFSCSCLHYRSALAVPADAGCAPAPSSRPRPARAPRLLFPCRSAVCCPCSLLPLFVFPTAIPCSLCQTHATHTAAHVKRRAGQQQHSQEGTGSMLGSCRAASLPLLQHRCTRHTDSFQRSLAASSAAVSLMSGRSLPLLQRRQHLLHPVLHHRLAVPRLLVQLLALGRPPLSVLSQLARALLSCLPPRLPIRCFSLLRWRRRQCGQG